MEKLTKHWNDDLLCRIDADFPWEFIVLLGLAVCGLVGVWSFNYVATRYFGRVVPTPYNVGKCFHYYFFLIFGK